MANHKRTGTLAEYRTMRWLEADNYRCQRAAASLGEWDIIAIGPNDVRLCQVKAGFKPYCSPAEREAMQLFPVPPGVRKELWFWKKFARKPIIEVL